MHSKFGVPITWYAGISIHVKSGNSASSSAALFIRAVSGHVAWFSTIKAFAIIALFDMFAGFTDRKGILPAAKSAA